MDINGNKLAIHLNLVARYLKTEILKAKMHISTASYMGPNSTYSITRTNSWNKQWGIKYRL